MKKIINPTLHDLFNALGVPSEDTLSGEHVVLAESRHDGRYVEIYTDKSGVKIVEIRFSDEVAAEIRRMDTSAAKRIEEG